MGLPLVDKKKINKKKILFDETSLYPVKKYFSMYR